MRTVRDRHEFHLLFRRPDSRAARSVGIRVSRWHERNNSGSAAAGLEVNREDVMNMGGGGILTEPSRRPERRTVARTQTAAGAKKIAAIVLAAGQSQRMGGTEQALA